jgi:hypothetical protein
MVYHKIYFKGSSSLLNHLHVKKKAYYRHHHVNRQTNKKFSQECLPACTWKKILLIALESPELCSTLAAIKELVNRRHKELITMKNFEKG